VPLPPDLEDRVAAAADVLRRGGLVAYPTETFYGLGALARDAAALDRLAHAKLRPEGKPLPLLAADVAQVKEVALLEGLASRLAARFWPGPLTLVLPAVPGLDAAITAGAGTVAVRVPGSEVARALARRAGGAIVSTSANLSGSRHRCRRGPVGRARHADRSRPRRRTHAGRAAEHDRRGGRRGPPAGA
jgi:L-threonylcarbamoyladenylate synthase